MIFFHLKKHQFFLIYRNRPQSAACSSRQDVWVVGESVEQYCPSVVRQCPCVYVSLATALIANNNHRATKSTHKSKKCHDAELIFKKISRILKVNSPVCKHNVLTYIFRHLNYEHPEYPILETIQKPMSDPLM